ncbi:hypothetical protein P280DRAFT_495976 [Massarina eburnea CBS 473.64]|uniref:Uncharacterized protein n=1 Tax=Massarina eburnea CBS 473.64 TaxID=1395130 RepID=A0A6A6SAM7_9PLEO|nr:hypothetical protein P280DRAFT_495976 [Massarina eburnea CBS 473.64]
MAVGKYKPLTLAPINFSLTEGTSIPAPPDSPPDTPRPPTPGKGPLSSHPTPQSTDFPQHDATPPTATGSTANLQQTTTSDNASTVSPASPTTKRPNSVRKFLGLRPLSSHDSLSSERPGSPSTLNSQPGLSRKKSTSWFGKRKSSLISGPIPEGKENQGSSAANGTNGASTTVGRRVATAPVLQAPPQKKGPPPPALPELTSFGVSEDSLSLGADDMFKNIK